MYDRMMRYGLFTERMKVFFDARKPDEHMFLSSIDFLNFKLFNHLYGSGRGNGAAGSGIRVFEADPGDLALGRDLCGPIHFFGVLQTNGYYPGLSPVC